MGPHNWKMARFLALGIPLGLLGGAYFFQYGMGLYPCEMCWWQRYPHFIAVICAGLAFVPNKETPIRICIGLAALAVFASGLIGAFHAGVEYKWWEGVTKCALANAGDVSSLEAIWDAPLTRCDEAAWTLFGISMAGYNFLISTISALVIAVLLLKKEPVTK